MLFIKYTTLIVCLLLTCISETTSRMFRFWRDIDFFNTAAPARGVFVDMVVVNPLSRYSAIGTGQESV